MKIANATVDVIETFVSPIVPATSLDIWKASGGISHQTVRNALKELVDKGRLQRTQETFNSGLFGDRKRYLYRRVVA